MELDWKTNSSRDFSLVVWSDGSQEVEITSDLPYSDTIRSAFPLTERREDDNNAIVESQADACVENPKRTAFKDWHQSFEPYDPTSCGTHSHWVTYDRADEMYFEMRGGCRTRMLSATLTLTEEQWDKIWISDGTVQISSTPDYLGNVTKVFNLQSGVGNQDRVAFYVPGETGLTPEDMVPKAAICYSCLPQASYQVLAYESAC